MKRLFTFPRVLLFSILLFAAVLRFWNLGSVPPSTSSDEASISYNAYSVLKTGGDEYGVFPLVSQRAYDDWRRSTYLLLSVPSVGVFGLDPFAIRFPSVILSILTVWATYEIVLLLFKKRTTIAYATALLSATLLAISPWHVYISRLGHESNACLSFLVFGMLFFLQGLKTKWKLFVSILFFALSLISYYSGQIFVPLMGLGLLLIFRERIWRIIQEDKRIFVPIGISILFLIPVFWSVFNPAAMTRFSGTSTFSPSSHGEMFAQEVAYRNKAASSHNIFGEIYYNRRLFPVKVLLQGYFSHFSPVWLFTNGGEDMFKAPNTGLLYLWELPCILIGIVMLLKTRLISWQMKSMVFLWFFLGPLPPAVATQTPHAMRAYNILPTWQLFSAFGIISTVVFLKKVRFVIVPIILIAAIVGLYNFCYNYFVVFPHQQSHSFEYAASKAMPYVLTVQNKYSHIIFSNTDSLYQSYMSFLYYSKFDPKLYQKLGGTKSGGYAQTHSFGKYSFRPINWAKEQNMHNTLFIGNVTEFPAGVSGTVFTDLDGKGAIKIVATD